MTDQSPTRLYALLLGASLVLVGMLGFLYSSDFTTGDAAIDFADDLFGVFKVNGWHNLLHLLSGLIGIAAATSVPAARLYAVGFGAAYTALGAWGIVLGPPEVLASSIPVDAADNLLHLVLGLAGIAAFAADRRPAYPPRP